MYFSAWSADDIVPAWADSFFSNFGWTEAALDAFLASVYDPQDPDPTVVDCDSMELLQDPEQTVVVSDAFLASVYDPQDPDPTVVDCDSMELLQDPEQTVVVSDSMELPQNVACATEAANDTKDWTEESERYLKQVESVFRKATSLEKWFAHRKRSLSESDADAPVIDTFDDAGQMASSSSSSSGGSSKDLTETEKQELIQSAVPIFSQKQLRFKWGGCPYHKETSLQVHLIQSGDQKGSLVLRCSYFWKKDDSGQHRCFWNYPFPMKLLHLVPKQTRDEYQDLKHVLMRNARPR